MFTTFTNTCLGFDADSSVSTKQIQDAYIKFNKSSTGRNKLYAFLAQQQGVKRVGSTFEGICIKKQEKKIIVDNSDVFKVKKLIDI